MTSTLTWNERLRLVRGRLKLTQPEMAEALGVTREWISKIESNSRAVSELLQLKIEQLEKVNPVHFSGKLPAVDLTAQLRENVLAVEESAPRDYGAKPISSRVVASRIPQRREPSTRNECEAYIRQLLDAAELSDNPNAFPVIHDRLKKQFPLEEWAPQKDQP